MSQAGYAGDVDVGEAWLKLAEAAGAQLVDVRTRAEWSFVGIPDLSALAKEPILVEWQSFPSMEPNAGFLSAVMAELEARGAGTDPVFFICRSGARSASAAAAVTAAGRSSCFNVAGGFEGRLDVARHRGVVDGWKAAGLPWVQS